MLEIGEPMDIPSGTRYTDVQNNGNSCERDTYLY
jgi:hypothetical protein